MAQNINYSTTKIWAWLKNKNKTITNVPTNTPTLGLFATMDPLVTFRGSGVKTIFCICTLASTLAN